MKDQPKPTEPPGEKWNQVDYDDRGWLLTDLPLWGGYGYQRLTTAANLYLRGLFEVPNPHQAGPMKLSLSYRGGVVVYLNGKEIGRGHMPKGKLEPDSLAEDYALSTYLTRDANGQDIGDARILPRSGYPARKWKDRYERRIRTFSIEIPSSELTKGDNVLALAVYRSATLDLRRYGLRNPGGRATWNHLGVREITLAATRGASERVITPPVDRMLGWVVSADVPARPAVFHVPAHGPVFISWSGQEGTNRERVVMVRPRTVVLGASEAEPRQTSTETPR